MTYKIINMYIANLVPYSTLLFNSNFGTAIFINLIPVNLGQHLKATVNLNTAED